MACLAADVRACEAKVLANEVNQQQPRLDFRGVLDAVYFHFDIGHGLGSSFRARNCELERSRAEHPNKIPLVFSRSPDVVDRLRLAGRDRGRLSDGGVIRNLPLQERFSLSCLQRSKAHIGETNARALAGSRAVERYLRRHAGRSVVADLPLKLQIGAAARRRWNRDSDLLENLIRLESSGEQG